MSTYPEYSLDIAIAEFFSQTSATRDACDTKAKDLVGGKIVPVTVQVNCSYSVYAGPEFEFILGGDGKEPLFIYVMNRIPGISYLDFVLANGFPENSDENFVWRKTLVSDVARFFALSWKAPQEVDSEYRENLRRTYSKDLQLLLHYLPPRFHQIIQKCLSSMEAILSLLMVLLHRDFGSCNIIVDGTSCRLTGVIDWAEAEICPFGQNLHSLQTLTGALHLKMDEVGDLSTETMKTIKTARIMGLLRSRCFTKRLANMPPATPIRDDETGRYNMLSLDGFLVNPATRFDDLD
ncbi:hypothetical protein BJ875DRAFT_506330 [Amylocarpus encephaloides]|uniref:Aminoglycoside phosphotransferase domain-containing protein n=1 Tax=Amylocarpus encephaloides TaxID=45428 RepID=A0A9P8C3C4_9HELO|nr:hypothetical protein BJ875DRAFT_506330 [Amylocarpus encephaloides]